MTAVTGAPQAPPSSDEIANLKRLAAGIIRAQGNRFIKELLRAKRIRIGVNKDDFERNLTEAIESGFLRLTDVDEWLKLIEGWGNQHVYLYNISRTLQQDLTKRKIRRRVHDAELDHLWEASTALEFPDQPTLTSISFTESVLRLSWQEASPGWTPEPEKNFQREEGLDVFEYRAYRLVEQRAITRFEAHLDRGLAALFVASPVQQSEHRAAVAEAKRVIALLMSLRALEREQVDISVVSRNVDQQNVPSNAIPDPDVRTQKSRLESGGAYVEFAANSPDKAYWEEPAIQNVRRSVRGDQLNAFEGTDGVFIFRDGADGLARSLRVQLYGKGDRVRLWAQMDAGEVWTILTKLSTYQ